MTNSTRPLMASLAIGLGFVVTAAREQYTAPVALHQPAVSVDRIFSQWTGNTPGCAAGVSVGGKIVAENAYGLAVLEA